MSLNCRRFYQGQSMPPDDEVRSHDAVGVFGQEETERKEDALFYLRFLCCLLFKFHRWFPVSYHQQTKSGRSQKIPAIARNVFEDGHLAVAFGAWRANEHYALLQHVIIRFIKVIDTQEKADATCELVTDGSRLSVTVGLCEQYASAAIGRPDDDPAFWSALVGE